MFDISNVVDKVGGLFGQGSAVQEAIGGNLSEVLGNTGLDPAMLENLPIDQVGQWLSDAGIDPATLGEGQLAEIVQQVSEGGVEGLDISNILSGGTGQ